jgi:hypothetical protein
MRSFSTIFTVLLLLLLSSVAIAQNVSNNNSVLLSDQDFPIANVDNMFIPVKQSLLIGLELKWWLDLLIKRMKKSAGSLMVIWEYDFLSYI